LKNAGLEDVHCGRNEVIFSQVAYSNLTKMSVKGEVSEKNRKLNSN